MTETEEFFLSLARPSIRLVEPYDARAAKNPRIRLSANENNFGAPKQVLDAMRRALTDGNRYPDGTSPELRAKLAARHALHPEQIITSNGLDGLFTMLGRAFLCAGDEVVCGDYTFGVYESTAVISGASVKKAPSGEDFVQKPERFANAAGPNTKMLFFCNPNNPTGAFADAASVRRMLESVPKRTLVVLDEAYFEFTGEDESASFALLEDFPNLIICRTFSKIFALAGLRVGWAAADPGLISCLYRGREPYCVTAAAEAGACAALDEDGYFAAARRAITEGRERLSSALRNCGAKYLPSRANFILIFPKERYEALCRAFEARGIGVRLLTLGGGPAIRLSVGTSEENEQAVSAIEEAFRAARGTAGA